MAEPTQAFSFSDLVLRVAEETGMAYYGSTGQSKAMLPVDAFDLDRCKRIVTDGFRSFMADAPVNGWKWTSRIHSVTLVPAGDGADNIDSDPARYLLPAYFGGEVDGQIEYAANTNHAVHISWVDEAFIRARRTPTVITSYPTYAAIRPYQPESTPSLNSSRRFELIVDPQPSAADVLEFPFQVCFDKMELETGNATGGTATTLVDSGRTELDDHFNTWVLTVIEGTGIGETATITDYAGSTGTFTFSALSGGSTPDSTSVYKVEPANNLHPAGFRFDNAIKSACFAQAEMEITEFDKGYTEKYYKWDLPRAHEIDKRAAPRTLGNMNRRIPRYPIRTWHDVTTDHDL